MKRILELLIFIIIVAVLGFLFFYLADTVFSPSYSYDFKNKICFNPPEGKCFFIQVAKTDLERQQGLMFQKSLGEDKGVLFIFDEEDIYPFWMKNTLIPLDIIWIANSPAGGKTVVFMNENSQPCGDLECPIMSPSFSALYVLEINAGLAEEFGIKAGSVVQFEM